jgi:hypothetical protein
MAMASIGRNAKLAGIYWWGAGAHTKTPPGGGERQAHSFITLDDLYREIL